MRAERAERTVSELQTAQGSWERDLALKDAATAEQVHLLHFSAIDSLPIQRQSAVQACIPQALSPLSPAMWWRNMMSDLCSV